MSDLLSREDVLSSRPEYLNPDFKGKEEYHKGWNDCISFFYRTIKEMPVSYDLDAVLEQLERLKRTNEVNQNYATAMGFRQAIEIVKAGGIGHDEAAAGEDDE